MSASGPGDPPPQGGDDGAPKRRRGDEGGGSASVPRTRPRHDPRLDAERRMLESLVCPATLTTLEYDREAQELVSRTARLAFPIRDGAPIMLVSEARPLED